MSTARLASSLRPWRSLFDKVRLGGLQPKRYVDARHSVHDMFTGDQDHIVQHQPSHVIPRTVYDVGGWQVSVLVLFSNHFRPARDNEPLNRDIAEVHPHGERICHSTLPRIPDKGTSGGQNG